MAETGDQDGIFGGDGSCTKPAAGFPGQARSLDRAFDADGRSVKWATGMASYNLLFECFGIATSAFFVERDVSVETRVQPRNAREVSFDKFNGRDLFLAD